MSKDEKIIAMEDKCEPVKSEENTAHSHGRICVHIPETKLFNRESATACSIFCLILLTLILWFLFLDPHKIQIPEIEIELVSMDFAATVHNDSTMQQSHYGIDPLVSARWDLMIRVPKELVGNYMCLQGTLEASLLYKNVSIATSSIQSYNILELGQPQLLNVSAVASEEDLSGAIGKEIMEDIKERNEVPFGSRFSLAGCRKDTKKGMMNYDCGEATLRFEPSGSDQIKATAFGNQPSCIFNL